MNKQTIEVYKQYRKIYKTLVRLKRQLEIGETLGIPTESLNGILLSVNIYQNRLSTLEVLIQKLEPEEKTRRKPFVERIKMEYTEPTKELSLQDFLIGKKVYQFHERRLKGKKLAAKGKRKTSRRWSREGNSLVAQMAIIESFKHDYAFFSETLSATDLYRYWPKVRKHYKRYYYGRVLHNLYNDPNYHKLPRFLSLVQVNREMFYLKK
jgi:hypothetical protein